MCPALLGTPPQSGEAGHRGQVGLSSQLLALLFWTGSLQCDEKALIYMGLRRRFQGGALFCLHIPWAPSCQEQ